MTVASLDAPNPPWIRVFTAESTDDLEAFVTSVAERCAGNIVVPTLLGARMRDFGGLFDEFATKLRFPPYFGRNYNALKDCLTDLAWLPGDSYVLIIRDAAMVLTQEEEEDFSALLHLLQSVSEEWARPVVEGEAWDRAAVPFHVVLQTTSRDLSTLLGRLAKAGVPPAQLGVS
jgi:RNAse (barnase) inhibitor barstar